jgi:hypothetical protein
MTALGPREGFLGGLLLDLGIQWRETRGRSARWGWRLGPRLRVGYGALWPTDVLFPAFVGGSVRLGLFRTGDTQLELDLSAGALFPNLVLNAAESYFRSSLSVVLSWDAALSRALQPSAEDIYP